MRCWPAPAAPHRRRASTGWRRMTRARQHPIIAATASFSSISPHGWRAEPQDSERCCDRRVDTYEEARRGQRHEDVPDRVGEAQAFPGVEDHADAVEQPATDDEREAD